MASRIDLQDLLEKLLGSRDVYYQSPGNNNMNYPAIKYNKDDIQTTFADDQKYLSKKRYSVTVIDRLPDNPVIDELLALPYCSYDRFYKADNLNHDVLTLYW